MGIVSQRFDIDLGVRVGAGPVFAGEIVPYDTSGGGFALTLPAASTNPGVAIAFKEVGGSANTLTITPNGGDTIEGAGSLALSALDEQVLLVSDGTSNWMKLATSDTGALVTSNPPVNVTKAAAVVGTGVDAARDDHKHDVSTAAAVELTDSTNAEGAASTLARSNHTHAHGSRGGGSLHAAAIAAGAAGFMSGADKSKVDNLPTSFGVLAETIVVDQAVNTSTIVVPPNWATLLTTSVTIVAGNILLINFSAGASNGTNNREVHFRLIVDGVTRRGVGMTVSPANSPASVSMVARITGLAAGPRTVTIEWQVDAGTGQVRPVLAPDTEHATLLIQRVTI
jgi:hypothetical protein